MNKAYHLILTACLVGAAGAAVTVTDNGLTAPTLGANDTGYTGATTDRFGWDTETFGQTFSVASPGTIDSIYLGYNAFDDGDTITITLSVNGSEVVSGLLLDGNNFSGDSSSDSNASPYYWMRFDLSSEAVPVTAGSNSFTLAATANTGNSWALAPRWVRNPAPYAGGAASGLATSSDADMAFVVTVVPEPGSLWLCGLGALGFLRRRRG
jgi:hypothetical protein